jgi:hypothetical protein
MNEKEQNFDRLKQLLKLKQHEVPPPGYFNNFSGKVVARIRAGEAGGRASAPWFASFMEIFETRPGWVGGFAASLCLLLVFGVIFAEHSEGSANNDLLLLSGTSALPASAPAAISSPTLASASVPAAATGGIVASTNPVTSLQPVTTLFGQPVASPLFQSASFAPAGQ